MGCSSREEIVEVSHAFDAALDRFCKLSFDGLTTPELLSKLEHFERAARRLRAPQHTIINQLDAQAGEEELGGTLRCALADRLRITKAEASRRIADAEDLGERRALIGRPARHFSVIPCATLASLVTTGGFVSVVLRKI